MPNASDRQQRWPLYASQARRRTEETAEDHGELLRRVLTQLQDAQQAVFTDPQLVHELLSYAQRDVALTIAALSDIQRWMAEAKRGRSGEESHGAPDHHSGAPP